MLFNTFITDLDAGPEHSLSKVTNNTNWGAERHCVVVLPSRGTETGWRTGLRKCLWSSTRVNAESCIWGEVAWDTQTMLEGWKTAQWMRIWEPWGTSSWARACNTPSMAKKAMSSLDCTRNSIAKKSLRTMLPKRTGESPSVQIFKTWLEMVLRNLFQLAFLELWEKQLHHFRTWYLCLLIMFSNSYCLR